MAWPGIFIFIYVDMQEHAILLCLDPFLSNHLIPERKTIWAMLGSNPAHQLFKRARYPLRHRLSGYSALVDFSLAKCSLDQLSIGPNVTAPSLELTLLIM